MDSTLIDWGKKPPKSGAARYPVKHGPLVTEHREPLLEGVLYDRIDRVAILRAPSRDGDSTSDSAGTANAISRVNS